MGPSLLSQESLVLLNLPTLPHSSPSHNNHMGWFYEIQSLFQTRVNTGSVEFNDTRELCNLSLKQNKKEFLHFRPLCPGLEVVNDFIFY